MNQVHLLVITSTISIDGELCRPGKPVEVSDSEGKNLLQRGKARLPTAAELAEWFPTAAAQADAADTGDAEEAARLAAEQEEAARLAAKQRAELDAALAELPDDYTDPDFVVNGMRSHFGDTFTEADEAKVRELVKAPPPPPVPTPAPAPQPDAPPPPGPPPAPQADPKPAPAPAPARKQSSRK